jgi:hypothetical protein
MHLRESSLAFLAAKQPPPERDGTARHHFISERRQMLGIASSASRSEILHQKYA